MQINQQIEGGRLAEHPVERGLGEQIGVPVSSADVRVMAGEPDLFDVLLEMMVGPNISVERGREHPSSV